MINIKNLILMVITLSCHFAAAQSNFFKKKVSFKDSSYTHFRASICNDNGYLYTVGLTSENQDTLRGQGIMVSKFDTLGNLIKSRVLIKDRTIYYLGNDIQLSLDYDDSLLFMYYGESNYRIVKMNNELDIINQVKISNDLWDYLYSQRHCFRSTDGYIVTGQYGIKNSGDTKQYMIKVDTIGNRIWAKTFAQPRKNSYLRIGHTDEDYLAYVYFQESYSDSLYVESNHFLRFNADGDTLSLSTYEIEKNSTFGYGKMNDFFQVGDNKIITIGSVFDIVDRELALVDVKPYISIIDTTFQRLKTYEHGEYAKSVVYPTRANELDIMPDGNFLATGHILGYGGRRPFHIKFTPEGEILWTREDTIYAHPQGEVVYHEHSSTSILPSGNIMTVGNYETWPEQSPRGYIMKMSKDGCFDPECTGRLLLKTDDSTRLDAEIHLYPNPTSHHFEIESDLDHYDLQIHSQFGRLIKSYRKISDGKQIIVDGLDPGMYYVRISNGKRFAIRKLIKM